MGHLLCFNVSFGCFGCRDGYIYCGRCGGSMVYPLDFIELINVLGKRMDCKNSSVCHRVVGCGRETRPVLVYLGMVWWSCSWMISHENSLFIWSKWSVFFICSRSIIYLYVRVVVKWAWMSNGIQDIRIFLVEFNDGRICLM